MFIFSEFLGLLVAFSLLLSFSAFLSASETALISVNKVRLSHLAREGKRRAQVAHELVLNLDKLITTILVWNCLVNTAIASIGTLVCLHIFSSEIGVLVATVLATILILIFGEISPKIFAISNADKTALFVAYPIKFLVTISRPVIEVFTNIGRFVVKLVGGKTVNRTSLITEEEMRFMIEAGKEEGIYGEFERGMLHRIFNFGDLRVEDVMIPLARVNGVPITATEDDLFQVCVEEGRSRVPVFKDEKENILGLIYTKDLLYLLLNDQLIKIPDIMHEPYFVPPMMQVSSLLKEFLKRKIQIAIVGYKSRAVGLVTLEDLLEEIVGEIDEVRPAPKKTDA